MQQRLITYMSLIAVLASIWLAYRPGLDGGFLFDDFANLSLLGATGPIDNEPALARYLTSGTADPTGRPIPVASFLIDARDWPADPYPFKRTNLLIHLLNTTLLASLLLTLGRRSRLDETHAQYAAILGAAFWGLHPLFVSTTLYIVQREAMLPVTFTTIGLLLWLKGRQRLMEGRTSLGVSLELAGICIGTIFATLSKANGVLFPLYALLFEYILLRRKDQQAIPDAHRRITYLLWLATLLVFIYLLHTALQLLGGPPPFARDWTLDQRLLTEPRVLWQYLFLLWLPHPFTAGLFNDQVAISTQLLVPWTTLPSILGIGALIIIAWITRRRWPLWSTAILFFFAGHLIESSVIPLELYFEHRNYLPALLLFWPLSVQLLATSQTRHARLLLASIIVCGLAVMTHTGAQVWGNTAEQTLLWAQINPQSPRAQSNAAQLLTEQGNPAWAQNRLRPLLSQAPGEIQIAFNLLGADCKLQGISEEDLEATQQALKQTRRLSSLAFNWLGDAIAQAKEGSCKGLTLSSVESLLDAMWSNPSVSSNPGWQQDIFNLRGKIALAKQEPKLAYQQMAAALLVKPNPATALEQAAVLGTAGQQKLAICELELWEVQPQPPSQTSTGMALLHEWVLNRQNYWPKEIAHLKSVLKEDLPAIEQEALCPDTTALTPIKTP